MIIFAFILTIIVCVAIIIYLVLSDKSDKKAKLKIAATDIHHMMVCGFDDRENKSLPRSTKEIMRSIRLENEKVNSGFEK